MPNNASGEDESAKVYAIRLAGSVGRRLVEEYVRQEEQSGPDAADRWRDGMLDTIQSLATLPGRCAVAREDRLFPSAMVRQILYTRWRLLFTIHEADENDPAIVWVRHIRHGAEAPLKKWPAEDEAT